MILVIFVGCLIPYFLGGLYLNSFLKDWLYNNSIRNSQQTLNQVDELIERSLIADMKEEVNYLASLDILKNSEQQLNNYSRYSEDVNYSMISKIESSIADYFRTMKESHPTINFIFFGNEDGGYIEYPRFTPSQSYDPRLRPWYKYSIWERDIVISEPYMTNVTQDMVVSFTKSVFRGEESIGVIGISVNLEELSNSISKLKIGKTGYVMLLSPENKFIVATKHMDWILKTPRELGLDDFEIMNSGEAATFETVVDGEVSVLNTLTTGSNGLHVITVMSKDEILQNANIITSILLMIFIVTLACVFFMVFQISKYITRPILEIASVINHMTDFDFSFEENSKVDDYAKREDEIGTVSSALLDMHNNFKELMTQVNHINNEIMDIDIEKKKQLVVELSQFNPFHNVISSMNALMNRIDQYVKELRDKNQEMQGKNELLTASEEELIAQVEEIEKQKEYINFIAYHDALTGLPNRRSFIEDLENRINSDQKGAVILLDIDDFKGINDTQGHVFGDRVLQEIANRLQTIGKSRIFVSRFGGDEFLIHLECEPGDQKLELCLNNICQLFDEKLTIDEFDIEIHFSMGISLFPMDSKDVNQLVMNADLAMYSVKSAGKNGYKLFDFAMMDGQIKKSNIEAILREAIEKDGFKMVYQPKIDVKSGKINSYEALLRLKEYNVPPSIFIDIAEKNGSIIKIGRIVTHKVIKQIADWKQEGLEIKPISFNFSANQLHDNGYLQFLQDQLEKYQVETKNIEIEITENIFMENQQITRMFLKQLKELGIRISIDDFGSGFSSLNYLAFHPVDSVKLDRSLSLKFLELDNMKVMDSLISLVHSLGLNVIAEGIEELEQVQRLCLTDCDLIQGYFFSKPIEVEQISSIHYKIYKDYRNQ
jgi:diguanylate cyclase (GGDEF)-like protein